MGNQFKGKVGADAKKRFAEYRKTGRFYNTAIPFDHSLQLSVEQNEHLRPVFESCNLSTRKESQTNFEILLANLFEVQRRHPVIVSLNSNEWKKTQYTRAGNSTIKIINKLHKRGYIEMKKGHTYQPDPREARIWATEKLLSYFRELPHSVIYEPVCLVELKDAEGKLKEYRDTARTLKIKTILKAANKVNGKAEIRCGKYKLDAFLVAIFNRKFTLYGRLHTRGSRWHYQGFSGEERQEFTINGDRTTELDFSGFHPHLLYAKEGLPFSGDPYSIVDERPEARPFLKQILLSMLYSKDEITAGYAANFWLYKNHAERENLKQIGITRARPMIDAFKEAHKPIAHYFCNGKDNGLRIMNLDAQIALDIINAFVKQKKPILAIHDSFIVQRKYRDKLERTMQKMYQKHTGFNIPITIEF